MGCTASKSSLWTSSFQRPFRGAGCLFQNKSHALVGLHTRQRGHVRICGFGGKREADEPWWQTAFRETIEELLEPERISFNVYHALASNMSPHRILYDEKTQYVCLVFVLEDLVTFLRICEAYITSPLYHVFPRSLNDLMFRRVLNAEIAEISEIVLWPMRERHRLFRVTRDILTDFNTIVGPDEDL